MKILIVSDTHRQNGNLSKVISSAGEIDMLIHCGDVEGSEDYIRESAGCPVKMVAGNNDFFSSLEKELEFNIGKYHIFLTHGHYYYVSLGPEQLAAEARARGADIVMYGHTHRPSVDYMDEVIVVNPGSLSYPRQDGRQPSYIVMEIDREGTVHFTVNYIGRKN